MELFSQVVDLVNIKPFGSMNQQDIDDDPLVVLKCGHAYTASTMDGIMDMEKFYKKEDDR